ALAHLGHGVDDRHPAVAIDAQPLVRREHVGIGPGRLRRRGERQPEADDEPGAERGRALEELAAGELEAVHPLLSMRKGANAPLRPPPVAARWIALRMR